MKHSLPWYRCGQVREGSSRRTWIMERPSADINVYLQPWIPLLQMHYTRMQIYIVWRRQSNFECLWVNDRKDQVNVGVDPDRNLFSLKDMTGAVLSPALVISSDNSIAIVFRACFVSDLFVATEF